MCYFLKSAFGRETNASANLPTYTCSLIYWKTVPGLWDHGQGREDCPPGPGYADNADLQARASLRRTPEPHIHAQPGQAKKLKLLFCIFKGKCIFWFIFFFFFCTGLQGVGPADAAGGRGRAHLLQSGLLCRKGQPQRKLVLWTKRHSTRRRYKCHFF